MLVVFCAPDTFDFSFQLLDIFTFITPVRDAFVSTHFLSLTLTWIYPLSWANRRQVGSHLWAWLPGNKEGESKRESECVRKRGTWWQRKNSHVVAKRRGEIWERWFNCLSQTACHSRSTGDALELEEFIMQARVCPIHNQVSIRLSQLLSLPKPQSGT